MHIYCSMLFTGVEGEGGKMKLCTQKCTVAIHFPILS